MFKIGDKIKILDGSDCENYIGGWNPAMEELVGKTYVITDLFNDEYGNKAYRIKAEDGLSWVIDPNYAISPYDEMPLELPTIMPKESDFELTEEQREELIDESMTLLQKYEYKDGLNYDPSRYGINEILNKWQKEKGWIVDLFRKHPAYNGKGQIVLTEQYSRKIDREVVLEFGRYVRARMDESDPVFAEGEVVVINGNEKTVYHVDLQDDTLKTEEDYDWVHFNKVEGFNPDEHLNHFQRSFFNGYLPRNAMQYADENFTKTINNAFPWLKAHNGAKVSKLINRICKHYKINEAEGFSRQYTRFADAVNPLEVTRYTVLSVHPIDYWTMSFGNDWTSCHSVDKTDLRGRYSGSYQGCYSAGTESYMLDPSSFVVYIVDKSYDGNEFELQDKLSRQMFHIGEDKLIQGRLYPQANDVGAEDTYTQIRNTVQRVIAECYGVDNSWTIRRGTGACSSVIDSYGQHYRDYEAYDTCVVSYLKRGENVKKNTKRIQVGERAICPQCGEYHDQADFILCEDCSAAYVCGHCGSRVDLDYNGIETVDGHYFCDGDCAESEGYVYCYNRDEWRSRYEQEVFYDDYDREWHYDYYCEYITTEDGHQYANECNANDDGYYQTESGEWYHESELYYCEKCGRYFADADEYDHDRGMCKECAEEETLEDAVNDCPEIVVTNSGEVYSGYEEWVNKYGAAFKDKWTPSTSPNNGDVGRIVTAGRHRNGDLLYGIMVDDKFYVIGTGGVEMRTESEVA